jgi:signal peptidase I
MRRILVMIAEPVVILALAFAIGTAARSAIVPVRVAGWSMGPTLAPGDIVLVQRGAKPIPGDVVLVAAAGHAPMLHRVVELLDGGQVRTKGDANEVADEEPASPAEVTGRAVAVVPVGSLIARWRGGRPYATIASQSNSTQR